MLKDWLVQLPSGTHLCFVGDGPALADLQQHFAGLPVTFTVSHCSQAASASSFSGLQAPIEIAPMWAIKWYLAAPEASGMLRGTLPTPM